MSENKSIDGLAPRGAKKSTAVHSVIKKSTPKKSRAIPIVEAKNPEKKPSKKTKVIITPDPVESNDVADIVSSAEDFATETTVNEAILGKTTNETESTPAENINTQAIEDFLSPTTAFEFDGESGELKKSEINPEKTSTPEESETEKPKKKEKKKKEKKKRSKVRLILSSIALVIVLALIAGVLWVVFWGNDIIAKITGGQGNVFDLLTFIDDHYDPLKTDANGRTNILAFGTSGYNMEGDEGEGVHAGAQLTDSIMAISLNQETGDIAMLSLPRDLKASPTCTATGKINEVYWCNNMYGDDEASGAAALMTEVGDILGMDFQYYAHLNWGSLVSIVDTLGGIKVTLDEDINDAWWTGAVYEAGVEYTLNGEEALGLARARHGTMGGDFSRGASQQKILVGIKDRIFEKDLSITDIIGLASTLGDNFRSNFNVSELKTAAHLTYLFDFDSMRQISLYDPANGIYLMTTGTLDNGISYVFPRAGVGNYGAIQEYVAENLSNDPRVYEHPTILILNATDETGKASSERTKLKNEGYEIAAVDNAPADATFENTYTIYINGNFPGTKTMLEKYYGVYAEPISEAPESISRDYNFVIVLGPTGASDETNE